MNMSLRVLALSTVLVAAFAGVGRAQDDEEIERAFERAEKMVERGQWSRAYGLLETIVKKKVEDEDAARLFVLSAEASGRYEEFEKTAAAWAAKKADDREWRMSWVTALRLRGKDDAAAEASTEFVKQKGGDYLLESVLGDIHLEHGRDAEAEKVFEALVDRAKTEIVTAPDDLVGLARAYRFYPHGDGQAETALNEAIEKDKKNLRAMVELSRVLMERKYLWADAKKALTDALKIRPRWPGFLLGIVAAYDLALGFEEAERSKTLDEAYAINPRHPEANFQRGMQALGDAAWERAREFFSKGLSENPAHKRCLAGMAALGYVSNDRTLYDLTLRKVLTIDPGYGEAHRIVALALNERRRWDECVVVMQEAVRVEADNPVLWDDLARYALYTGLEAAGTTALKKADDLSRWGTPWRNNMKLVMAKVDELKANAHGPFVVKFDRAEDALLRRFMPAFLERSFAEFKERYGFEPKQPILVEVFKKHPDFSVRTMGTAGLGALGVCFGGTVYMLSPAAQKPGTYNWAGTAHHELAHVFTLQLSKGRTPRWLTEGLSTWEEVRRSPSWGRGLETEMHDALANEKVFPVLEFDGGFHGPRIIFAYYQGGLASEWIEKVHGLEKIRKMLALYGEDKHTPVVLKEALGLTPAEFDQGFRDFLVKKFEPLKRIPTYDADSVARFKSAIAAGKDGVDNRIRLLWAYHRQGARFDADGVLKELNDAKVDDWRIDFYRAEVAFKGKAFDVADEMIAAALKKGAVDFDLFMLAARRAEAEKKSDLALEYYRAADRAGPFEKNSGRSPKAALARLLLAKGSTDEAMEVLEGYAALSDVAVETRWQLLEWRKKRKETAAGEALLDQIHLVTPYDPKLYRERARVLAESGDKAKEIETHETALDIVSLERPDEIRIRKRLGTLYFEAGRKDDAIFQLERVVELAPDDKEAAELLRRAEGN